MEEVYISLGKYIDAVLSTATFILIYRFKKLVKEYYIKEIKLINVVERFYRVGLAHLALMGEPPLVLTQMKTNKHTYFYRT